MIIMLVAIFWVIREPFEDVQRLPRQPTPRPRIILWEGMDLLRIPRTKVSKSGDGHRDRGLVLKHRESQGSWASAFKGASKKRSQLEARKTFTLEAPALSSSDSTAARKSLELPRPSQIRPVPWL